jgi:hypothetical protein
MLGLMPTWAWYAIFVPVSLAVVGYVLWWLVTFTRFFVTVSPVGAFLLASFAGLGIAAWTTGIWWIALFIFPVVWLTMWLAPG